MPRTKSWELTIHSVTSVKNSLAGPPRSTAPSEVPMSSVKFTDSLLQGLNDFRLSALLVLFHMWFLLILNLEISLYVVTSDRLRRISFSVMPSFTSSYHKPHAYHQWQIPLLCPIHLNIFGRKEEKHILHLSQIHGEEKTGMFEGHHWLWLTEYYPLLVQLVESLTFKKSTNTRFWKHEKTNLFLTVYE